jgi:Uri superfamily endonuclease
MSHMPQRTVRHPPPIEGAGVSLPDSPGSYVLVLRLTQPLAVDVGSLGRVRLPASDYVYSGSACGPGGLRARVGRHLQGHGRQHWHIDSLREHAGICAIYFATTPVRLECVWSQALAALPGAQIPVRGFGASDCSAGCHAHLVALPSHFPLWKLQSALSAASAAPIVYVAELLRALGSG